MSRESLSWFSSYCNLNEKRYFAWFMQTSKLGGYKQGSMESRIPRTPFIYSQILGSKLSSKRLPWARAREDYENDKIIYFNGYIV